MGLGETLLVTVHSSPKIMVVFIIIIMLAEFIHIALMGDPTLRMHIIVLLTNLTATVTGPNPGIIELELTPDSVLGYYLYQLIQSQDLRKDKP